jgi:hypothetical protein
VSTTVHSLRLAVVGARRKKSQTGRSPEQHSNFLCIRKLSAECCWLGQVAGVCKQDGAPASEGFGADA